MRRALPEASLCVFLCLLLSLLLVQFSNAYELDPNKQPVEKAVPGPQSKSVLDLPDACEPDDSIEEASPLEPAPSVHVSQNIGTAGDVDYFSISSDGSQRIWISTITDDDTVLYLYGPDGSQIESDDDDGQGLGSLISGAELSEAGNYYIAVRAYADANALSYDLYVTLRSESEAVSETGSSNDTAGTAQPVAAGEWVIGLIDNAADEDYYSFSAEAGTTIALHTDDDPYGNGLGSFDTVLTLYDRDGSTVLEEGDHEGTGPDEPEDVIYTVSASGTYYVSISNDSASITAGYYGLAIAGSTLTTCAGTPTPTATETPTPTNTPIPDACESDDDFANARLIQPAPAVRLSQVISYEGDIDFFQFESTGSQRVWLSTVTDDDTVLYLYGPDESLIESDDDDGQGLGSNMAGVSLSSAGTYYIQVKAYSSETTLNYDLYVSLHNEADLDSETGSTHDTATTAQSISLGSGLIGLLNDSAEEDYYSFYASSGTEILCMFDDDPYDSGLSEFDAVLTLYDTDRSTVIAESDHEGTGPDEPEDFALTVDSSGTYYLKVSHDGSSFSAGYYALSVCEAQFTTCLGTPTPTHTLTPTVTPTPLSDSCETNDTLGTASTIEPSPCLSISSNIGYPGDVDYYTFESTGGQRVWLSTQTDDDTVLSLLSSDGTVIEEDDDDGDGLASNIAGVILEDAGTYAILVEPYNSSNVFDYELYVTLMNDAEMVEEDTGSNNDTASTAQSVATGQWVLGELSSDSDVDYYSFNVSASPLGSEIVLVQLDDNPGRLSAGEYDPVLTYYNYNFFGTLTEQEEADSEGTGPDEPEDLTYSVTMFEVGTQLIAISHDTGASFSSPAPYAIAICLPEEHECTEQPTATETPTPKDTATPTVTATVTMTETLEPTATGTLTPSMTPTATDTPTSTRTATATSTETATATETRTPPPSRTPTATRTALPTFAPDDAEPNDSVGTAFDVDLPPWVYLEANIADSTDEDYYSFEAVSGQRAWAFIEAGMGYAWLDTYIELIHPDGSTIVAEDDDNGPGQKISGLSAVPLDDSGTYTVKVTSKFGDPAPYTLWLGLSDPADATSEAEINDVTSSANMRYFGSQVEGAIDPIGDEDWVRFFWNGGPALRFVAAVDDDPDRAKTSLYNPRLQIETADGFLLRRANFNGVGPGEPEFLPVRNMPGVGMYYLRMDSAAPLGAATDTYLLTFDVARDGYLSPPPTATPTETIPPTMTPTSTATLTPTATSTTAPTLPADAAEPNDATASAYRLYSPPAAFVNANFHAPSDVDHYGFEAAAGQRLWAAVSASATTPFDTIMVLTSPAGAVIEVDFDDGPGAKLSGIGGRLLPMDGLYTLMLRERAGRVGNYTLWFGLSGPGGDIAETEINNTTDTADPFQLGNTGQGALVPDTELDSFRFHSQSNTPFFAAVDDDPFGTKNSSYNAKLILNWNDRAMPLRVADFNPAGPAKPEFLSFGQLPLEGLYTLQVTSSAFVSGSTPVYRFYADRARDGFLAPLPTQTPTATPPDTLTPTATASETSTIAPTATSTVTLTSTPTVTPTGTQVEPPVTPTTTATPSSTQTPTVSSTPTATETMEYSPSPTLTGTPSSTATPTGTRIEEDTPTPTETTSVTPTATGSREPKSTATSTATHTVTHTATSLASHTPTPSVTETPTATYTEVTGDTPTPTATGSATETPTGPTATATITPSRTISHYPRYDLDGNDMIEETDLLLLLRRIHDEAPGPKGDLNDDGTINCDDLMLFSTMWARPVPAPSE